VQFLIIAEACKQADSSESCREARVGSVVNYPKSDFTALSKIEKSPVCRIYCTPDVYIIIVYMTKFF